MLDLMKKYSDQNPERFNSEFIKSRKDQDIEQYVRDIFNALEIIDEIKVESIKLETDESQFGPIKSGHKYYKSILPSRLNKIHYRLKITPSEIAGRTAILDEEEDEKESVELDDVNSFIKEGDIYLNKLIDDCFYINEGVRYFLIYQVVDNATYGTGGCVSLKSLLMPITLKCETLENVPAEFEAGHFNLDRFETLLFSKRINPILYILGRDSYNSLVKLKVENQDDIISEWEKHKDPGLIDSINKFFGTDLKFADKALDLDEEGRVIFKITDGKETTTFMSISKGLLETNSLARGVVGSFLHLIPKLSGQKKTFSFTYDNLITPWFWIEALSTFFTKNGDSMKKFEKIRTMLISLDRLMDDATRKILNIPSEDKKDTLTVIRYIMRNFEKLVSEDNQDLGNKRLRLFEYQVWPLRKYFSDQIYRVLNSPTRSKAVLNRMFSNLSPMFVIKQTVVNELLRYYNSTNELNLYACLLKYTFRGPQSLNKTVSMEQRDLHPSYAGRLSLIASSASDPGLAGTLTPFVEVYDGYFEKQEVK